MCQQHMQCDSPTPRVVSGKLGHYGHDGHFQVKQATFVEDHGHSGGCHDLGNGCQIKNTFSGDFGRVGRVSKSAERLEGNQVSSMGNSNGSGRECMLADSILQNFEGTSKHDVLLFVARSREGRFGESAQWEIAFGSLMLVL